MSKELKDYLHLYLPIPVELNNGGSKVYNRVAVAVGNMDDEYRYVTLRLGSGKDSFTHAVLFSDKERIKPILRKLSSMTEEEIKFLFNCEQMVAEGVTDISVSVSIPLIEIKWKNKGEAEFCYYHQGLNQLSPRQFHYLLSKHFDLFDLIDDGLAIDKETLNQ